MRLLADTRHMPLETAAAVYEADGADHDFMRATSTGAGLPLDRTNPTYAYRDAAETLMQTGFTALNTAEDLKQTLTAATDRVRRTALSTIPQAALDFLAAIYVALTASNWSLAEPVPLHLIHALEDTCELYGVITGDDRTTCVHARRAADCATPGCCA
ncbi:hypothetical protein ACWDZ4_20115 [Streptomyces sp. NPDC003016]